MTNPLLLGVNLAGAEFGSNVPGSFGTDYTYPTHVEIDYYAGKGLSVIRLPFLWERLQRSEFGALDATELARLDDVVNYATSKGLKIEIEPHDYGYGFGALIGSAQTPNSAFADFWSKVAQHFAANARVIFGLMNEPHDQSASAWLASANAAIAAIRGAGATQEILVPGSYWDGAWTWTSTDNAAVVGAGVQDPGHNFAFEVHQYLDADGSGTHPGAVSSTIGVERLTAATQWAEATGNRLFLGEVGVTTDATSLTALDGMLTYMQQHTDAWQGMTYWAGGPWWGDYMFSIEPQNGADKPQMAVLLQHLSATPTGANPPPPAGTSADMILRHGPDGLYEIYDIGTNSILAAYQLGQVGTDWQFVGLGGFFGSDTADMLLRSASTGGFEVYDIASNNITNAAFLGTVGMEWQVMGFGNFATRGETDMLLRNVNTGGLRVYDIRNNQITGAAFMGTVGLNWQFSGVGNFSGRGTSDMLLRNANTGGLEVYDISNNAIANAAFIGAVGLDWQFSGVGNFSGVAGETDLLLRNANTGGLEVYDISNNQLTGAAFLGTVGLEWQFAGVAPIHPGGAADLVLRNVNTGVFAVYDISNNRVTGASSLGQVGSDWQLGGFAADPSLGSAAASSQIGQVVQAMAGFGGGNGAAQSFNTAPLAPEMSLPPLLTTPQHA
jgi:endoglucanase